MQNAKMGDMMSQLLPYIPKLLSILSSAPAIAFGFFVTCVWYLFILGPTYFRESVAPIAGFHVVALVLFKRVYRHSQEGRSAARALQQRKESVKSFAKDIKLMSHGPKLD